MNCTEVLQKLELYLDGQLPEAEGEVVREHAEGCAPCMDRREFRVALQAIVRKKCGSVDVPPGLLERIRSSIRGRE